MACVVTWCWVKPLCAWSMEVSLAGLRVVHRTRATCKCTGGHLGSWWPGLLGARFRRSWDAGT